MKISSLLFATSVLGHAINGRQSIISQLSKRDENDLVDMVYNNLPYPDIDYINKHLKELRSFNGSKCDACKNKMKYARKLVDTEPENQHLISLTLFKYCLATNKNDPTKCDTEDFFLTTQDKLIELPIDSYDSGFGDETSVNLFDNDFMHMLRNFNFDNELDIEYYCYFKSREACKLPETPDIDEIYDFDSKWPAKQPKHFSEPEYKSKGGSFNVLHVSDFHNQLRYVVGSEADCDQKTCCMVETFNAALPNKTDYNFTSQYFKTDGNLTSIELNFYPDAHYDENDQYVPGEYYDLPAGRGWDSASLPASTFGSYQCDAPVVLTNNTFKQISMMKDKNFEFALFTGDLVDHDKIHCTPEITKEAEILGFNIMKHYLGGIPVYASLGNHDTFPYGQVAQQKYDTNGTYQYNSDLMSEIWINDGWLPEEERQEIRTHYSGFSTTTNRGLKVISLNSNCYYQKNLWSYIDLENDPDSFGQWEFLINELVESEEKGQRVWIMAHIPSSDSDALPIQSKIFAKIVERFSPYTIANIFFGHTHRDQFKVYFSSNSTINSNAEEVEKSVVNMAWLSQSITPRTDYNPSFRYYEVEDGSFNIMNVYNYYAELNATYVNGPNEPVWKFEYSPRDIYDPEHTWPETSPLNGTFWNDYVLQRLLNTSDIDFNQQYTGYQYRLTPTQPKCNNDGELSDRCYNENYCEAGTYLAEDFIRCLRDD